MALVFKPKSGSAQLGDVAEYSVSAEAVSTDVVSTSGSTGSMQLTLASNNTTIDQNGNRISVRGYNRATSLLGREVSLTDLGANESESSIEYFKSQKSRGQFSGVVSSVSSSAGDMSNLSVDGLLYKFNCEKTAEPHFGPTATEATAFIYYCSLVGITADQVDVDLNAFNIPVAYGAWKGNVWDHIKMFCVANKADVFINENNQVALRKIRRNTISVKESSGANMSVNLLGSSRAVEIYEYSNSWESDALIYSGSSAFQVDMGEQAEEIVDVEFSTIDSKIIQPECVDSIQPVPFKGGIGKSIYVVLDKLNVAVKPEWWNDNGGKVFVSVSKDNPLQLVIKISAPNQENSAYSPPYRLAEQYDDMVIPALYICGEGVSVKKKLRTVGTGADRTFISRDSKATVDNPFIKDISYHLAQSAAFATGPKVDVSLTIGSSGLSSEMNEIAGSRFMYNNGYYRVNSANVSSNGIGLTAETDTTFEDLIEVFSETFSEFNETANFDPNTFTAFNEQIDVPISEINLISNSGFEVNTTGWTAGSGSTLTRDTGQYYSGVASVRSNATVSTTTPYFFFTNTTMAFAPGDTVKASAWVKAGVNTNTARVTITYYNSGGSTISQTVGSYIDLTSNLWTEISVSGIAPTGTVRASLLITATRAASGLASIYADDAKLIQFKPNFFNFNAGYPALTFDDVALYYADSAEEGANGMSFSDMAFMPLGDRLNIYAN